MIERGGKRAAGRVAATAVVAVVLGSVAIGCSSSDPAPSASGPSSSTTAAPATSPPTTQDEAADEAVAEAALLTVDEVPGGPWVEGDPRSSAPGTGLDCDDMAEESAYFEEHAKGAPGAKAPELNDEANQTALQLDVNIVATQEVADEVAGFFADERFPGCLESRLLDDASTGSSAAISDVAIEPLDAATVGDSSVAWSVSFTVTQGTETVEIGGIVAFVQVGRGFSNLSLISQNPVGAADIEPIMAAAGEKLEAALA